MEGQIDSYEIVITAFLNNECNHHNQVTQESGADAAGTAGRTRAGGRRETPNQKMSDYPTTVSVICLS